MPHEFDVHKEIAIGATPEQVWDAIASGPGLTSWFMPHEVEPGEGGVMRLRLGELVVESRITTWDPPRRLAFAGGTDEAPSTFEFLVEARDGGSAVLRFVHHGVLGDDWEAEYDGFGAGWDMYLYTLAQYVERFSGRPVAFVTAEGPAASADPAAWPALLAALGIDGEPSVGQRVRLAGPEPVEGVVDYVTPRFLGVRSTDSLYRFHGRASIGMVVAVGHHRYVEGVDVDKEGAAWQEWLGRAFSG